MKNSTKFIVLSVIITLATIARLALYIIAPHAIDSAYPLLGIILGFITAVGAVFMAVRYKKKESKKINACNKKSPLQ
ncbi:hypothetical protein Emin_0614 [Elusimicrobium minutum Pei191]|uniref:Uncharacterized protein n=1 Tax=Elusimicrobium minutum (strain Pei191) TaxID=445932 RepID=B2KC42_ELUMP|nr:hypothetical protein [Elusimicrobium minutum]ACC98169.1 hypothetical protein Emin_0614 [Elusimicrobium minutum Pei191]